MVGLLMNVELERIWKEASIAWSMYYPRIRLEGLRKTMKTLRIADVSVDIRTEHLPNTSLERYWYTSIFGDAV
jgi:hypothetical protein